MRRSYFHPIYLACREKNSHFFPSSSGHLSRPLAYVRVVDNQQSPRYIVSGFVCNEEPSLFAFNGQLLRQHQYVTAEISVFFVDCGSSRELSKEGFVLDVNCQGVIWKNDTRFCRAAKCKKLHVRRSYDAGDRK